MKQENHSGLHEKRPNDKRLIIPPLEPGACLTRAEFERRYEAMPHLKKAELIDGVVYMPSPVRIRKHGNPHARLITWLGNYESATPGVITGDNSTARLDLCNEPQPDALLLIAPECGGQATISAEDYIESAPELVGEIAASSASYDLHAKLDSYKYNGVKEYIVWRVLDKVVDWFVLRGDQYELLPMGADGLKKSTVFPGLWLDDSSLVRGDLAKVLAVVQQGTQTREHAKFVDRLRTALEGDRQ